MGGKRRRPDEGRDPGQAEAPAVATPATAYPAGGRFVAVDRVEGDVAVLIDDEGQSYELGVAVSSVRLREGMVLRVADGADGRPDWRTLVADRTERGRRLADLKARVARLAEHDDGGDIAL